MVYLIQFAWPTAYQFFNAVFFILTWTLIRSDRFSYSKVEVEINRINSKVIPVFALNIFSTNVWWNIPSCFVLLSLNGVWSWFQDFQSTHCEASKKCCWTRYRPLKWPGLQMILPVMKALKIYLILSSVPMLKSPSYMNIESVTFFPFRWQYTIRGFENWLIHWFNIWWYQ